MTSFVPLRSMEVVALADGRFGVSVIESESLPRTVGEFDTREEADAWILQQGLLGDESAAPHHLMTPGPSLDID